MCDRIQNAIGIMVLKHWEVMRTVGRNDFFHYTIQNIQNTSARELLLPSPSAQFELFSTGKERPAICLWLLFAFSQGINNLKVQCIELLGNVKLHSFTMSLLQNTTFRALSLYSNFIWTECLFINRKHSPSCLIFCLQRGTNGVYLLNH